MIEMMVSGTGKAMRAQPMTLRQAGLAQKMIGLAIVVSGFAVIFAHGLQHIASL